VIEIMNDYAIEDALSPPIVGDAARIMLEARDPNDANELAAGVWRYVHDRVRFTRDQDIAQPFVDGQAALKWNPVAEALIRPREMSKLCTWDEDRCQRIGDCDDFSMWCASILYCIGIPCSFVTVAGDPDEPDRYSHVYVAARWGQGSRTAIDASHGHHAGDEVPNRYGKLKEWPVKKGSNFAALLPFVIAAGLLYLGWRYSAL
jgi:transglutaminase-like putative cysteine protease